MFRRDIDSMLGSLLSYDKAVFVCVSVVKYNTCFFHSLVGVSKQHCDTFSV